MIMHTHGVISLSERTGGREYQESQHGDCAFQGRTASIHLANTYTYVLTPDALSV